MNIEKLEIEGLYGYFDKVIDFNHDLTLLVGINGSGKTSILNIIQWMIRPSIPNLCVTEFKAITLKFSYKSVKYIVSCKHNKTTLRYDLKTDKKGDVYNPLIIRIKVKPSDINSDEALKAHLLQIYSQLRPEKSEKKTWDLLSKFPTPTIIGLDRNLDKEEGERIFAEDTLKGKVINKSNTSTMLPHQRVKDILNTEYRKSKNIILNLTNNLKNQLMLSTFDGSITIASVTLGIKQKLDIEQIQAAEDRVKAYFKKFERHSFPMSVQRMVASYFAKLKKITKEYQEKPDDPTTRLLYGLNANQFIKVNKLLKEFGIFELKSKQALEMINLFLDTINYFLKDSAKKLLFKEDTSEITFNTLDKNENVVIEHRDIKFLSSGEQQILILFTYMAFNSKDGRIFIIDEPELSLHIKWQQDFLDYLNKITPISTQLILATHSPILVSKKREKVKLLFPYNN